MILIKRAVPFLCLLLVVFMVAVPASAAEDYYSILPEQEISLIYNTSLGSSGWLTFLDIPYAFLTSPITFVVNGTSYSGYFTKNNDSYFIGNGHLYNSEFPDTGEDFFIGYVPGTQFGIALRGNIPSATIEIYAGTKPVDPSEDTTSLLSDLGSVAGAVMQFVSTVADTIVSTPLLLLTVGFFFGGGCVGIFGRILSKN